MTPGILEYFCGRWSRITISLSSQQTLLHAPHLIDTMDEIEYNRQDLCFGSLSRISDLKENPFIVRTAPRDAWETGDYVIGRYLESNNSKVDRLLELCDGSFHVLKSGDIVVGALGERCATQEVVGSWKLIGRDAYPIMHQICGSGMFGIETSRNVRHKTETAKFIYEGHCFRQNKKLCMKDFAPKITAATAPNCPMVLIVGSSMSCGKTISGKIIIEAIKELGIDKVVGVKLTGGGYKHDTNQMLQAGAFHAIDFVDAGFCSTVMPREEFCETALPVMLAMLSKLEAGCVVAELGASPLEPYNGLEVLKKLLSPKSYPQKLFTILCATDAYAAFGMCNALRSEGLNFEPNLVCGMAANNSAGIALVESLTGFPALNLEAGSNSIDTLRELLKKHIIS